MNRFSGNVHNGTKNRSLHFGIVMDSDRNLTLDLPRTKPRVSTADIHYIPGMPTHFQ